MRRILIVTSPFERAHFFPDGLDAWVDAQPHACRLIEAGDPEAFNTALADFAPEVVVGAWDCPPLPLESVAGKGGSVAYFCYLSGSAKKQITPAHLEAGLILTTWGAWIGPYVAECALLLILSALRRVAKWGYQLKATGQWRERLTDNRSLFGKRVGLRGFGAIAQSLVELMQPFGVVVTADTGVPDELLERYGVRRATSTEDLFRNSDILVELKPLTPSTEKSVTESLLRLLPEGAAFINIGRGAVVDEAALIKVAREGRIQVALDVYAEEPLPKDSPMRTLPNVFLLPHMGGATVDRGRDCGQRALRNVENFLAGQPLENQVDLEQFERST
jgi:phosphoglycerate dehydrogenase-like enzyme